MLLTPLFQQALNWSQGVNDFLPCHKSFLYWDKNSHKFTKETSTKWWHIVNFALFGAVGIPFTIIFFYNTLLDPNFVSVVEFLLATLQICMIASAFLTAVAYRRWGMEQIRFLNELIAYERFLRRKHTPLQHREEASKGGFKVTLINLPKGKTDWLGIVANMLIIAFAIVPVIGPWMCIFLDFDLAMLLFRHAVESFNLLEILAFHICRSMFCVLAMVEVCNCYRTMTLTALPMFRGILHCYSSIMRQPLTESAFREHQQLKIVFLFGRDFIGFALSVYLAVVYMAILLCTTTDVVSIKFMPWYFCSLITLTGVVAIVVMCICLSMVVSVDNTGSELGRRWMCYMSASRSFQRRRLSRILKSFQPIRIPYGTMGVFKKATRTDFFHSLVMNSINTILGIRDKTFNA